MKYAFSMNNIGFRAHDFGSFPSVSALAETVASVKTPAFIQLALGKVVKSSKPWQEWDEEYIAGVAKDLSDKGVGIAVVGCYINPVHPDENEREKQLERFEKSLELNRAFGCRVVGTETGSWTPDISYSLDTFTDKVFTVFLKSIERMVKAAEKYDAICAIEAVSYHHTICSVERMARVLETFPSDHLKVIYDPVNLIPINGIREKDGSFPAVASQEAQRDFYTQALDAYGQRICAIHCKDYVLDEKGFKCGDLPALTGVFDWKNFFKELRERKLDVPVLLENLEPATLKETLSALSEF